MRTAISKCRQPAIAHSAQYYWIVQNCTGQQSGLVIKLMRPARNIPAIFQIHWHLLHSRCEHDSATTPRFRFVTNAPSGYRRTPSMYDAGPRKLLELVPIQSSVISKTRNYSAQRTDFLIGQIGTGEYVSNIAYHARPFVEGAKKPTGVEFTFQMVE